jgi:hypothetical protein
MRQRLFCEKKPFVASGIHKNRETVTDRAHLARLAFLQMREGFERIFRFVLEDPARWVAPERDAHGHFESGERGFNWTTAPGRATRPCCEVKRAFACSMVMAGQPAGSAATVIVNVQ